MLIVLIFPKSPAHFRHLQQAHFRADSLGRRCPVLVYEMIRQTQYIQTSSSWFLNYPYNSPEE
jgi:hypothetical protein